MVTKPDSMRPHGVASPTKQRRPRLAFVLGSGGVRSVAAIGIADRLWRENIAFDLVAGCSSGALFGATIAMGMSGIDALRCATTLWSEELTVATAGNVQIRWSSGRPDARPGSHARAKRRGIPAQAGMAGSASSVGQGTDIPCPARHHRRFWH